MAAILGSGGLHYGMQLPIQAQSALFAEEWEKSASAEALAAVARACDRGGFAYIAVCDHTAIPRDHASTMGTEWWDTMTTLGWLAGITGHVRLLSHVAVLAHRHPMTAAKAFATLDVVSGGRAVVGAGAGHVEAEFAMLGRDFGGRGAALDESLELLDLALREEFVTYAGERFRVDDMGQRPRPVQVPRPPIWVGGSAAPALRRAARYGDGWLPQGSPRATFPGQVAQLRRLREEFGRADEPLDIGAIPEPLYVGTPGWDVGDRTVTGSPERIAESLRWYREQGAHQVQVRFRSRDPKELIGQIEVFAGEVAPLLGGGR
ncbi:TIGR03619 family F420-dependent LLM class oxidoreductase [Yinghuangia sp. ASG 101]|uniref:LLM class flavin-dependent oxidoreductase n=1 Tax=Yinghuangia sp. ASG 101 TaxID=2896848 RepID=UPI001E4A2752|nr:TIGR03619 family F420-dependent LLM class oxidoreductase [Yinghuangia sp. ASG 101]UGQ09292.1 TIGR03619 family F420-dependent LLM class oxidoreductase [Yinghuangia sp. ASG 101]